MKRIILASGSPRRKQLLEQAEIIFEVNTAALEEVYPESMPVHQVPEYLAQKKATAVMAKYADPEAVIIIAADTVVVVDNQIIGKPRDAGEAIESLQLLSGKSHEVITGVVLQTKNEERAFSVSTRVFFKNLSEDEIQHYVRRYNPLDKAGAYAIQEWIGLIGIEKIEGDFYNVMGLPINTLVDQLAQLQ